MIFGLINEDDYVEFIIFYSAIISIGSELSLKRLIACFFKKFSSFSFFFKISF